MVDPWENLERALEMGRRTLAQLADLLRGEGDDAPHALVGLAWLWVRFATERSSLAAVHFRLEVVALDRALQSLAGTVENARAFGGDGVELDRLLRAPKEILLAELREALARPRWASPDALEATVTATTKEIARAHPERFATAIDEAAEAPLAHAPSADASWHESYALLQAGRAADAEVEARRVLGHAGCAAEDAAAAYATLGGALRALDRGDAAWRACTMALAHQPTLVDARWTRMALAEDGGDPAAALADLEAGFEDFGADFGHRERAEISVRLAATSAADERAALLDAALADAEVGFANELPWRFIVRGQVHLARGEAAEAIRDLSEVIDRLPNDWLSRVQRARAYALRDEPELAIADLRHALRDDVWASGLEIERHRRPFHHREEAERMIAALQGRALERRWAADDTPPALAAVRADAVAGRFPAVLGALLALFEQRGSDKARLRRHASAILQIAGRSDEIDALRSQLANWF